MKKDILKRYITAANLLKLCSIIWTIFGLTVPFIAMNEDDVPAPIFSLVIVTFGLLLYNIANIASHRK